MPVVAHIVVCKKCGFEIRSGWNFCPNCGDKIVCAGKYKEVNVPDDPVGTIRGMLAGVRKSGVELQHESRKIRVTKAVASG